MHIARSRGVYNAVFAVLLVCALSAGVAWLLAYGMHQSEPCNAVNVELTPSPDGAYFAREAEVSCRQGANADHGIQIAVAMRNPRNGKPEQFVNVLSVKELLRADVDFNWTGPRSLDIRYPKSTVRLDQITSQQPQFRDVLINFIDSQTANRPTAQ